MERELQNLHAVAAEGVQEARREVQARRRRGDRSRRMRVDGLVALAVLRGRRGESADVRRQRRLAVPIEQVLDRAAERLDDAETVRLDAHDAQARLRRGADDELDAGAAPAAGPHERAPASPFEGRREQELDRSPAGVPRQDARRDDARVVDDEAVTRPQEIRKLGEHVVFERRARAVDHEEPRRAAHWARRLGDQLRREIVVELREVHGTPVYMVERRRAPLAARRP